MVIDKSTSKDKILKAALALFTKKGIKSTTTKELARKARIAEGTIYTHFKCKEEIAHYLFKHYMGLFSEHLNLNCKDTTDPEHRMKALINAFFDFADEQPTALYYIVIVHYTELNVLKKEKFTLRNIFADAIEYGIKKRRFARLDKNLGAALIVGMINRVILSYNNGFIDMNYNKIVSDTNKAAIKLLTK
ncbi:MAG: TetR/AcrR family transcriptional regulator [Candidatus Dadabacteria bacterium]|nr:TetR/AcrR family transcriptional regulator [Candidatus Dadabacteria bacterium]NIS07341.1 TetR/AcrR family transcriptional regulator [Candidatus Dadabacteria bacterium]NIV41285.1 TetR family transcriptional regulator [Candidatus Dadabacteria bacterium]NIX14520.1 TetR family transcriptional regulator [Candidatus Dadabacteria bacterium]NIY20978.1 TetR family transcriptional regulator [Candidatus Dadabacteria bacterium]